MLHITKHALLALMCRDDRFTIIQQGNGKITTMKGLVDTAMTNLAAVIPSSTAPYNT